MGGLRKPSTGSEHRLWLVFTLAVIMTVGSGCAGPKSAESASDQAKVEIKLFSFNPKSLSLNAGTSVVWTQGDDTLHTVTSGHIQDTSDGKVSKHPDATFDSGNLAQGAGFEFSFEEPGTYTYFCNNHPEGMRAEVIVG